MYLLKKRYMQYTFGPLGSKMIHPDMVFKSIHTISIHVLLKYKMSLLQIALTETRPRSDVRTRLLL